MTSGTPLERPERVAAVAMLSADAPPIHRNALRTLRLRLTIQVRAAARTVVSVMLENPMWLKGTPSTAERAPVLSAARYVPSAPPVSELPLTTARAVPVVTALAVTISE